MSTTKKALSLGAASAVLAFAMIAAPAQAADTSADAPIATASADDADTVEAVVVQGFRKSLGVARQMKRDAAISSDVIVAEDMAKFPDLNLAESLQRLPGVAINREAGEGRRLSLRGLGSDFTRVQLNGMEVLGNVDSPMDSRGQTSRDRAFDFNIFASELFSKVDVRKSFSAEQDEGGLAGTVGLYTAKPFDYSDQKAALSLQGGTNSATQDFQPRGAAMFSKNWDDKFGALVSIAYSKRQTQEQGYNTYGRSTVTDGGTNISALSAADQALIKAGSLTFARGNRLSVWDSEQERLGVTGALQWRPIESLTLTLDVLHGQFKADRDEYHLATRASQASTILGGTVKHSGTTQAAPTLNSIKYDQYGTVYYADIDNTVFATETRRQRTENTFDQQVLSAEWKPLDRLTVDGHIGFERSDYDIPISDKFYTEAFGGLITDYTSSHSAHNTYKWNTTDASNYRAHEIDFSATYQSTLLSNAEFNAKYDFGAEEEFSLRAGGSFRGFKNSGYQRNNDDVLKSAWENGTVDDRVTNYYKVFSEHDDQSWIIVDWDKALANYNVTRTLNAPTARYAVKEATSAGYVQLDWNKSLFGVPVRGNVGVRGYQTDLTSSGTTNSGPVTTKSDYSGALPALNVVVEARPDVQLRFSAGQNINRPALTAYAINGTVSYDNTTSKAKVTNGNPNLKPYTSNDYEASVEWYFGKVGMVAGGVFYKEIDDLVSSQTLRDVTYASTGLPDGIVNNVTQSTIVSEYVTYVNTGQAKISGFELSVQTDFFFLPGPLKNFGFVGNLTAIDSDTVRADKTKGAIWGMSDLLYNTTLYYEAGKWGGRVSANYRSDYPIDGGGFEATQYVDASAFYQLTPAIRLTVDGVNLTDERESQYSNALSPLDPGRNARRLWNTTTSGRTVFFGANIQF